MAETPSGRRVATLFAAVLIALLAGATHRHPAFGGTGYHKLAYVEVVTARSSGVVLASPAKAAAPPRARITSSLRPTQTARFGVDVVLASSSKVTAPPRARIASSLRPTQTARFGVDVLLASSSKVTAPPRARITRSLRPTQTALFGGQDAAFPSNLTVVYFGGHSIPMPGLLRSRLGVRFTTVTTMREADVVSTGIKRGSYNAVVSVLRKGRAEGRLTVWGTTENSAANRSRAHPYDADLMTPLADLSMAFRRNTPFPNFLRLPFWRYSRFVWQTPEEAATMGKTAGGDPDVDCAWPKGWGRATSPNAVTQWMQRPYGGMLISRQMPYPRGLMRDAFSQPATAALVGAFAAPSTAYNNMPWPTGADGGPLSKRDVLSYARFSLCPENSAVLGSGYVTEKVFDAHLAGAVPVYWGENPPESKMLNPARILVFDGTNMDALVARAVAITTDAAARRAFFAQPLLLPGARRELRAVCDEVVDMFSAAWTRAESRRMRFGGAPRGLR